MVLSTDQSSHTTLHECKLLLGSDKVRVQNQLVGGGFGGKEDMSVQHHAALITYLTGRTVKVKLTRPESLLIHPKRHPFWMDFTMGCDENGIIQGVKASVVSDTGAFASLGGPVLERACTHAAGPYAYENFEIEGRAYYTNNPPAGAFRGFGVTQTCFCTETLLNQMADLVGISPWEIRYRNAIRPGGVLPNGQIVDDSTGLVETLEAIKPAYDEAVKNGDPVGIACAMKNAGVGVGIPDWGRCKLIVEDDGKVHIYSGASCIGQGLGTVLVQVVVTNTGLHRDDIVYERSNTWIAPDSGDTSGSRQTLVTGEATRRACEKLKAELDAGKFLADLKGTEFYGEYLAKTDPLGADVPNPVSHVAYGYATQMCILDKETGRIKKMVAAHDVGKAVNPLSVEGQIEGGVVMSMGYALTEKYPIDENCKPTAKYGMLGLFRANQIPPEIQAIVVEKPGLNVAGGAIGIGEITSIPTAPAIAQAYYAKKQGLKGVTTETGAGQWGTALSMACAYLGLDCKVYMVKCSYEQKPFRREVMRTYGAAVTPSPSMTTEVGRRILAEHPDTTGSLGCAISEAVEVATHTPGYRYVLGSVLNQVLLHQSVIGLESKIAMDKYGVKPDVIIGCAGGGSNLGGLIAPFMGEKLRGEADYRFIAVEPASCPSLTRGRYAYDFCDTGMVCPLAKMYTLGSGFIPSANHAGGLRYHGMSSTLSQLYDDGLLEAVSVEQTKVFEAAEYFARVEGILPAPESSHAIRAAMDEAIRCRETGEEKTILFGLTGTGYFDLVAYQKFHDGEMTDYIPTDGDIAASLAKLPKVE